MIVNFCRYVGRALIVGCVIITEPIESARALAEVIKTYRQDGDR